jgi:regulator of RNase E activity RraA
VLEGATAALVSDALDRFGLRSQTVEPPLRPLRPGMRLAGPAATAVVAATETLPDPPYTTEIAFLDSLRPGEVGVYSVAAGVRAALWGELFSCAALGRAAAGVVVDGLVRDAGQIGELGFPTFCRGTSPLDTLGRAEVCETRVTVTVGGIAISPGDWLVADEDGVVVVPAGALDEVAAAVAEKLRGERGAREDLLAGSTLAEVWDAWRVL